MCLMRLHNYCIDIKESERSVPLVHSDASAVQRRVDQRENGSSFVTLDVNNRPVDLLGGGHHFTDVKRARCPVPSVPSDIDTPIRKMMEQVAEQRLTRPRIKKRRV